MTQADKIEDRTSISAENLADMEKHGIVRRSVDYFYHGDYRYTSLRDALAQAKRSLEVN